jgi:hypothetical protein
MKTIYTAILQRLREKVPALRWVDLDTGQLKQTGSGQRPPVAYPCALLSTRLARCRSITDTEQDCQAVVTVRLAFDPLAAGRTAANAPGDVREASLHPYDIIADVYKALQGFETACFNTLDRVSQEEEQNPALFVYKILFTVDFIDTTAGQQ